MLSTFQVWACLYLPILLWVKALTKGVMCSPVGPAALQRVLCKDGIWVCKWSFVCLNACKRKLRETWAYSCISSLLFIFPSSVICAGDKVCSSYEESSWPPYSLYGKRKRRKESQTRQRRGRGKTLFHSVPWQKRKLFFANDVCSAFMLESLCSHVETANLGIIWSRSEIH